MSLFRKNQYINIKKFLIIQGWNEKNIKKEHTPSQCQLIFNKVKKFFNDFRNRSVQYIINKIKNRPF